ncbi:MAG: hypothetical protein ABWZ77_07075, partial [Naasia sp.]
MKYGKALVGAGGVAIVAVVAGGWFLGATPLLAAAAASESELASVQQLNALQSARLAELDAQGTELSNLLDEVAALEEAVPSQPAMAEFLGQISQLERETGVRVTTLTTTPVATLNEAEAAGGDASATPEAASDTTAADPAASAAAPEGVTPAVSIPGMLSLPLTISAVGSADGVQAFLAALQTSGRFLSLSSISLSSDPGTGAHRIDL